MVIFLFSSDLFVCVHTPQINLIFYFWDTVTKQQSLADEVEKEEVVVLIETPLFLMHKQTHAQDAGQPDTPKQVSASLGTKRRNDHCVCVCDLKGKWAEQAMWVCVCTVCAPVNVGIVPTCLCVWVGALADTFVLCFCFVQTPHEWPNAAARPVVYLSEADRQCWAV